MSKPLLVFENAAIRAGERLRFVGTHWRFNEDEQWALIGPTGAGKSLFVNALCGRVPVTGGKITYFFDDAPVGRAYLKRGEIVLVSAETQRELQQEYAGYHQARWQSAEGADAPAVGELLSGRGIERISPYEVTPLAVDEAVYAARRAQAVELLGIAPLLERKIIHLSNGETRKVLLARALMQSPKLLILDDPFGGLDRASRETLARVLATILEQGRQKLLLVTSRREEIPDGVTRVLGVAGYQVVMQGAKAAVLGAAFAQQMFSADAQATQAIRPLPVSGWETSSPGAALIDLQGVNVSYGGVNVLRDITWTMRQGEHWAIRGPNGAGKSTLLSLILADNPQAYANRLLLFGRLRGSGESIWDIKRHIGWIAPELHNFYQSQSACQKVVCSGFFDSMDLYRDATTPQLQTAMAWMEALNIADLAGQPFQAVSVGEQRLVLLARALVKKPLLLILDEPCQGLDAPHRAQIVNLLNLLCEQTPVSLLYVTHHLDELPQAITHVLELEQGYMRTCGLRRDVD